MTSFVISDTHFGHTNSWAKFKQADGEPLRPFTSTEEMDEAMVDRWNAKVHPKDTVYHLGDVVINRKSLHHVSRLNGKLRLIRGNHDIFKDQDYRDVGFDKIYGVRVFVDKWIFSHIPLHPDCVSSRFRVNVHGHLHANRITTSDGQLDPLYHSVCVEQTNYEPVSFDELDARIQAEWDAIGFTPKKRYFNGSGPS